MVDVDAEIATLMAGRADVKAHPPARDYSNKLCICCRLILPKVTSFRRASDAKDGLSDVCVTCERRNALPPSPPAPKPVPRWRICGRCKQARRITQFAPAKDAKSGRRGTCNVCTAADMRARRQRQVDALGIEGARALWSAQAKAHRNKDRAHYNRLMREWRKNNRDKHLAIEDKRRQKRRQKRAAPTPEA